MQPTLCYGTAHVTTPTTGTATATGVCPPQLLVRTVQGPAGPRGPAGPAGPRGPPGPEAHPAGATDGGFLEAAGPALAACWRTELALHSPVPGTALVWSGSGRIGDEGSPTGTTITTDALLAAGGATLFVGATYALQAGGVFSDSGLQMRRVGMADESNGSVSVVLTAQTSVGLAPTTSAAYSIYPTVDTSDMSVAFGAQYGSPPAVQAGSLLVAPAGWSFVLPGDALASSLTFGNAQDVLLRRTAVAAVARARTLVSPGSTVTNVLARHEPLAGDVPTTGLLVDGASALRLPSCRLALVGCAGLRAWLAGAPAGGTEERRLVVRVRRHSAAAQGAEDAAVFPFGSAQITDDALSVASAPPAVE